MDQSEKQVMISFSLFSFLRFQDHYLKRWGQVKVYPFLGFSLSLHSFHFGLSLSKRNSSLSKRKVIGRNKRGERKRDQVNNLVFIQMGWFSHFKRFGNGLLSAQEKTQRVFCVNDCRSRPRRRPSSEASGRPR